MSFPKDPTRDYSVSNAEMDIQAALNKHGLFPDTQHPFYKLITKADFYFPQVNMAVFIDGEQIHAKREFKDEEIDYQLRNRGVFVRRHTYKAPITQKRLKEIVAHIIDDLEGCKTSGR